MSKKTIGFIGFGNMAGAIFEGFDTELTNKFSSIYACEKSTKQLPNPIKKCSLSAIVKKSDILLLGIKPQQLPTITATLKEQDWTNKCLISILAGVTLTQLQQLSSTLTSVIRVMPNTSAKIKESTTLLAATATTSSELLDISKHIFKSIGTVTEIAEKHMNFCTGLFGSGPAFIYKIVEELTQYATQKGLSETDSKQLVKQLFLGSSKMLTTTTKDTATLITEITSPNGTTQAGLTTFDELDIGSQLTTVIESAEKRANELSKTNYIS